MALFDSWLGGGRKGGSQKQKPELTVHGDIEHYIRGAVRFVRTEDGLIQPYRFTAPQMEMLEHIGRARRAIATSGVIIDFVTTGNTVAFDCAITRGLDRMHHVFETVMQHEGVLGSAEDGIVDGIDVVAGGLRSYTTTVTNGNIKLDFDNPSGERIEVRIFLPYIMSVAVGNLAVNGELEAAPARGYLLALGDSITQGFVVGCPSLTYPAQVATALGLDLVNQGIAGHMFDRRTLRGLDELRSNPPRVITVAYGTNDWARKDNARAIQRGAERYLSRLMRTFPEVPIYVVSPLWRADEQDPVPSGVPLTWVGDMLANLCGQRDALHFVDGYHAIPKNPVMLADGRLHPGSVDAGLVADAITSAILADGVTVAADAGTTYVAPVVEDGEGSKGDEGSVAEVEKTTPATTAVVPLAADGQQAGDAQQGSEATNNGGDGDRMASLPTDGANADTSTVVAGSDDDIITDTIDVPAPAASASGDVAGLEGNTPFASTDAEQGTNGFEPHADDTDAPVAEAETVDKGEAAPADAADTAASTPDEEIGAPTADASASADKATPEYADETSGGGNDAQATPVAIALDEAATIEGLPAEIAVPEGGTDETVAHGASDDGNNETKGREQGSGTEAPDTAASQLSIGIEADAPHATTTIDDARSSALTGSAATLPSVDVSAGSSDSSAYDAASAETGGDAASVAFADADDEGTRGGAGHVARRAMDVDASDVAAQASMSDDPYGEAAAAVQDAFPHAQAGAPSTVEVARDAADATRVADDRRSSIAAHLTPVAAAAMVEAVLLMRDRMTREGLELSQAQITTAAIAARAASDAGVAPLEIAATADAAARALKDIAEGRITANELRASAPDAAPSIATDDDWDELDATETWHEIDGVPAERGKLAGHAAGTTSWNSVDDARDWLGMHAIAAAMDVSERDASAPVGMTSSGAVPIAPAIWDDDDNYDDDFLDVPADEGGASSSAHPEFDKLVETVWRLRQEDGCPWDREQTHESITRNMIAEAYEAVDAINEGSVEHMREELGDVLEQVMLHSQIAADAGEFTIDDVCRELNDKLIRRHPHVFGDAVAETAEDALRLWNEVKRQEREEQGESQGRPKGLLDSIPRSLPALTQCQEISVRAARLGFEWDNVGQVWEKVAEESQEFVNEPRGSEAAKMEFGDLLFTLVNVARFEGIDAEEALAASNAKFRARWESVERTAFEWGRAPETLSPLEFDLLWKHAKSEEDLGAMLQSHELSSRDGR